jgi:hypothetical protein
MQRMRMGQTELSKLGFTPESDEFVESMDLKMRPPSLEPIAKGGRQASEGLAEGLSQGEKALILGSLRLKGGCDGKALSDFLSLRAGERELRIQNAIDSVWTEGRWKKDIEGGRIKDGALISRASLIEREMRSLRKAAESLRERFGLPVPTAEERFAALAPQSLTGNQKDAIRLLPQKSSRPIRQSDIEGFRSWVQQMDQAEALSLWRRACPGPLSLASAAHRMRFHPKEEFAEDEAALLRRILGRKGIDPAAVSSLKNAFASSFKEKAQWDLLESVRNAVWASGDESLLRSAQAFSEYRTLLDFMGVPFPDARARLRPERGYCMGSKNLEGNHSTNDDSYTSSDIEAGGRTMRLHGVFDGVSGHNGGYIASGIAKETIEIAMLAGWIASPEDARMGLLLADLAINLEKERYNHKRMGSTASISLIDGHDFYAITCGDSPLKVISGEKTVFSSNPHGIGNRLFSGLGIGPCQIDINNSATAQFSPVPVKAGTWVLGMTDGIGDVVCDHELHILLNGKTSPGKAAVGIVTLADSRREGKKKYELLCTCEPKSGKDDDMGIIADYIEK